MSGAGSISRYYRPGNKTAGLGAKPGKAPPATAEVRRPTVDVQRDKTDQRMAAGLLELTAVWGKKGA